MTSLESRELNRVSAYPTFEDAILSASRIPRHSVEER